MNTLAYEQLPPSVLNPLLQLGGWLMWFATLACIAYVIVIGGSLWNSIRNGNNPEDGGGIAGLVRTLLAGVVIGSSTAIAAALMTAGAG